MPEGNIHGCRKSDSRCIEHSTEHIEELGLEQDHRIWNFSPGDAPWWNGCCGIKIDFSHQYRNHRVSFSELQTVVFDAANLVNERPLGIKPGEHSEHSYFCPNDLISGRATQRVPAGPFDESSNLAKRFHFIQELVDTYWKKWTLCYLPTLIIQKRLASRTTKFKNRLLLTTKMHHVVSGN